MRVFLVGYYGFGNWGDELSLLAVSRELLNFSRRNDIALTLSALTQTRMLPQDFSELIDNIPRKPWSGIWRELRRCDGVIVGGGSLLQDTSSLRSFLYYWFLLSLAGWIKKPVIFFRCGLGPFHTPFSRWLTSRLMKKLALMISRDQASAQLAQLLKCPGDRIRCGLDPVFSLFEMTSENMIRDRIAIFIRPTSPEREAMLQDAVGVLKERTGLAVDCVGFHREFDQETVERIGRQTGCLTRYFESIDALIRYFSSVVCLFTMRLHPAIIASRLGIPWFAFDIDPKITALCQWWNGRNLLRWEGFHRESLVELFRKRMAIQPQADRVVREIEQKLEEEGILCEPVFSILSGNPP